MKAFQKSPISTNHAFKYKFLKAPHFDANWHFHSEYQLLKTKDFESILQILNVLHVLAHTEEYSLLANAGYSNSLKESDTERMNKVHAYVMKNFREKITLDEVAALANMTPSSFSRYFKAITQYSPLAYKNKYIGI